MTSHDVVPVQAERARFFGGIAGGIGTGRVISTFGKNLTRDERVEILAWLLLFLASENAATRAKGERTLLDHILN